MGEKNITTQVKIDGEIVPDFSFDWVVEFQGEKYIMPLRIPQGAKENTSLNSTIDLTFQHWAIYQLKRWPFVTIQQIAAGTYLPDEEVASVSLNLKDFCILFGQVLEYYYGGKITIDLNPAWQYKQEATIITISHTKIWNVLIDAFHDKYGVRWEIKAATNNSNTVKGGERYVIRVGYPTTEVDHIFEYGFEGGLLKVERQVQSEEIRNMLKGRGGDTNIPFRYFKDTDPNNKDFRPDPDWVEELRDIYFPNLMGATFRSYVQGWKAAHISKYPGYTAVGENNAYAPWAYRKGYTDTKFSPVEFVADEITINPTTGDKQVEILPGYSPYVKKGSSLDKYGPLPDTLDNNDDIYPTLQGTGLDIAVEVEQILSDDVAESTESDAQIEDKTYPDIVKKNVAQGHKTAVDASKRTYFTVATGKTAIIEGYAGAKAYNPKNHEDKSALITELDYTIKVFSATTGEERSASGIPAGSWYFTVEYSFNNTSPDALNVTLSFNSVKITSATLDDKWRNTFDIWVKNIWDSTKLSTETDTQYAERVWKPVLGDREGNTAKVVFTSGALVHEDYEFTIVDFPVPDTSKTYEGEQSHWRITLAKSEAELEATGLYVPSTQKQGKAGDTFVFIGTEMTHVPYVVDAEIRLDDGKKDQLGEVKEIKPTFVVTTDRVRLSNEGKPDALINQLRIGNSIRLADKRFIQPIGDMAYETLYLQSITYTYREPSSDDVALNPDVEIVLGNEYTTSANPVSMMQGEISALQRQVGAISNVEQIVRAVGDKLYLRKDGISDRSLSPTQFFSLLTSGGFRAGLVGGAGWGFYKDENGNWVLEADRVNVRQEMQVNTLVINQAEGRGGMEIDTAAYIDGVTRVVETDNGYVCYFDQKGGSVANLFHVDDVAFCNRWTPENAELKFYKRRITAVGVDNITLSKTDVNGTGIPGEGDNIIHFGNYTDKTRQYVKVRDVVGGGYERYIEELNSVNAAGVEYYFVGKQAGESRWFVGNKDLVPYSGKGDGSYIEYINRRFNLNNVTLSVNTTIGDKTIDEYIKLVSPPVEQEDIEGFVNAIVDPKLEGIQDQIDGVIETWFYNGVPTLNNYPASEWNTKDLKKQHLGDLYYDNDTGTAYRFSQNAQGGYYWNTITDDAITKALAAAKAAQDTANNKRRIFTQQPAPPYDKGDLWVNATYPSDTTAVTRDPSKNKYYNDILRCGTSRATGAFAIGDWGLSSNYTDDTLAQTAIDRIAGYEYLKNALLPENPTQITGGLIMSTLISLGYTDASNIRHTLAGMNGSWVDTLGGRTIGSWWGGPMVDLFDVNDVKRNLAAGSYATSLIRMDGSSYFANGLVGFRKNGSGWLAGDNIRWDEHGAITFGNGINIDLGSGGNTTLGGLNTSIASVTDLANKLSNLFTPYLGNTPKTWAEVSIPGTHFDSVKVNVGLWTDSFLSCLGKSDTGGSGGGAGGLVESIYRWADLGGTFSDADNDTFNAYTLNRIYSELTAADSAISARLANFYTKSEADTRYALANTLSGYVKKVGDTMTGTLTVPGLKIVSGYDAKIIIDNTDDETYWNFISFRDKGVEYGRLGTQGGTNISWNGNLIFHGGNYASYLDQRYLLKSAYTAADVLAKIKTVDGDASGLDADLLDGYHASLTTAASTVPVRDSDGLLRLPAVRNSRELNVRVTAAGWYRVFTSAMNNAQGDNILLSVSRLWNLSANEAYHFSISVRTYMSGYKPCITQLSGTFSTHFITKIRVVQKFNSIFHIDIYCDNGINDYVYISGFGSGTFCAPVAATIPDGYTAMEFDTVQGFKCNEELVANAATATRLQGTYKLWGQVFYGNDVSGNMTGVGSITPAAHNTYDCGSYDNHWNAVRTRQVVCNQAHQLWIWQTTANAIGFATSGTARMMIDASGNVGIGTTSPAYRLDVNGTAKVTALRIGDITIEEDKVNGGLHIIGGGLYADTFITALGVNPNDGSGTGGGGGMSYDRLDAWADYSADKAGYVLSALLGNDLYQNKLGKTEAQSLYQPKGSYVTLNTAQTITAGKTFDANISMADSRVITLPLASSRLVRTTGCAIHGGGDGASATDANLRFGSWYGIGWYPTISNQAVPQGENAMWLNVRNGHLYVRGGYHINGGTSSQFLKADGSVDSNSYALASLLGNYVTLNTVQDISGMKTFAEYVKSTKGLMFKLPSASNGVYFEPSADGSLYIQAHTDYTWQKRLGAIDWNGGLKMNSFIRNGGTAAQVLMADGSVQNHFKAADVTSATSDYGMITPLAMNQWTSKTFVKKSGDTMTGVLTFQLGTDTKLIFNNTDGEKYTRISFREAGAEYTAITASKDGVFVSSLPFVAKYFRADTETLCPNLNADLLDGYHGSDYLRSFWTASPGYDCDTITNRRSFCSFTYKNNAPFNGGFVDVNTNGYGFYLGTAYNSDQALYYRRHGTTGDGGMGAWQQLARITDNVASATKLQTPRTLWGRSFDGTANVSGDMIGVGSITATGSISLSASSVLQFKEAGYGDKFGIWGDFNGFDDENRMYIGSATGASGTDPALSAKLTMLLASGYIGLGTGSPTHRLHVNGYVRSNGLTLDGSHLLEWDAANTAWKFNGNLYATGGISALGITELSATEASVESLKAKSILFNDSSNAFIQYIPNTLWIGNMSGMIMFGDNQQSGSQIIMTNTLAFGGQKTSSGSSYYIDPSGDAMLKTLGVRGTIKTAASMEIRGAVFTVSGTEIYVTIGETKYKLTKTVVTA